MIILKRKIVEKKLSEEIVDPDLLKKVNQELKKIFDGLKIPFTALTETHFQGPKKYNGMSYYTFTAADVTSKIPNWLEPLFKNIRIEGTLNIFEAEQTWTLALEYAYDHPTGRSNGLRLGTYFAREDKFILGR